MKFLFFPIRVPIIILFLSFLGNYSWAQSFSTDGFYKLPDNDSRQVFSFNNGWLYYRGDVKSAQDTNFNDAEWSQVQLPHGVDILPESVSGCTNYQGIVWYRKHFSLPKDVLGKHITLTFEAIMGKCDIYLNGQKIQSHFGGYLPIVLDLSASKHLLLGEENTIAVMADNSDDPNYPPGKPQLGLDFTYYGGIYRDAWLVATNEIHITNPNLVHETAGGGVLVSFDKVSDASAGIRVATHVQNEQDKKEELYYEVQIKTPEGKIVAQGKQKFHLDKQTSQTVVQKFELKNPSLWHPDQPYLYRLYTIIKDKKGKIIDGYYQNLGVRLVELKGKEGLYLNGKPFDGKLIGSNHHQNYALVGNAVPNNLMWHDAKVIRDAGIRILRLSHYPQDPAFMDACDQLGIFTIVAIPGWQFWNDKNPKFEQLMLEDVRQTVRRDRNHPSVFAWEPVPNETYYPAHFAEATYKTTHEEYPFAGCIAACDSEHSKSELFDMLYAHPYQNATYSKTDKCIFTREWGDNVDNWSSNNSPSRAALGWGEVPQLVQAKHYANPDYYYTSWEQLYRSSKQHIGGTFWHVFDCSRGYHPDVFYGGIVDLFRRPKYSYEMFRSQEDPKSPYLKKQKKNPYTLFFANLMSPFSPKDITVYTNCDSVKLIAYGKETYTLAPDTNYKMPHPPLVFKNVFDFIKIKEIPAQHPDGEREGNTLPQIEAIGYANGKEVIREMNRPSQRPSSILLKADMDNIEPQADGSTLIPIFAYILDQKGIVKRLNETIVRFEVSGEGVLVGDGIPEINPSKVIWGSAAALVRTTLKPGKIRVKASALYDGIHIPKEDVLEIETVAPIQKSIYNLNSVNKIKETAQVSKPVVTNKASKISEKERKKIIENVAKQQTEFMQ